MPPLTSIQLVFFFLAFTPSSLLAGEHEREKGEENLLIGIDTLLDEQEGYLIYFTCKQY
jgi:hypothetical protein